MSMVKCEICKSNINITFLKKIVGTMIKDSKGKKHYVCNECQTKFKSKQEILNKLT